MNISRGPLIDEAALVAALRTGRIADAWRRRYQPLMEEVRSGRRPFTRLDVLHWETLETMLPQFGIDASRVPQAELDALNLAWHRLDPWPDVVPGLTRLKTRYIIAPRSNGNIILKPDQDWDIVAKDFVKIAERLGV